MFLRRSFCSLIPVVVLICIALAPSAQGASVLAGSDYLSTTSASFDFGGPIGVVALMGGTPPSVADTIVTRLSDAMLPAVGSSATIDIEMTFLSLQSVAPVDVMGNFFDVFVTLDPNVPSPGEMTINHEFADNGTPEAEGTFTSTLNVNFIAEFVSTMGGPGFQVTDSLTLQTVSPAYWSHEPFPGAVLVTGPPGDLDANNHFPPRQGFGDFFIVGSDPLGVIRRIREEHPGVGVHEAEQTMVPEPGTYVLLVSGVGLIWLSSSLRRKRAATRD
jgi:hypothetical protein